MSNPASTLSNVVSKLVRASMGASVSESVLDEDLDRHVADLILKEAREKEAQYYGKDGLRAYLPHSGTPESNLPKTNKRFLTTMLRSVDDHNASVIKQQQRVAEEAREKREEEERRERRKREADVAKERMRRLLGGTRRKDRDAGSRSDRDRMSGRSTDHRRESTDAESSQRGSRYSDRRSSSPLDSDSERHWFHPEEDYGSRSSRKRPRLPDESREFSATLRADRHREDELHRSKSRRDEPATSSRSHRERDGGEERRKKRRYHEDEDDENRHRAKQQRSTSRERRPRKVEATSDAKTDGSLRNSSTPSALPGLSSLDPLPDAEDTEPEPLSPSPGPSPPISKMDRYFEPTYDPRLDIAPISKDGFVEPGQFEGWDHMLAVLKLRKEEKRLRDWEQEAEKHWSSGKDKKKKKKDNDKGRPVHELIAENKRALLEAEKREQGLLDVKYKKRGEARDWDKGKVSL